MKNIWSPIFFKILLVLVVSPMLNSNVSYAKKKVSKKGALDELKYKQNSDNEINSLKTELLVEETEKKAIAQVKKLIKKYKGTPLEPDLLFRLAELYMRRSKSAMFFELNRDSEKIVSIFPKVHKKDSSKKLVWKAIRIYDRIQSKFHNFQDMDLVLFNEALACQQVGKDKMAEKLYRRMIKKYKNSPLIPDSHLAIGELAYKEKRFKQALFHFDAIKLFPDSRVFPYGLYKGAWALYNLRKEIDAIRALEKVVEYGAYVEKNNIDARLDLRREALSDLALFYEDVYDSKDALKYFIKQAGKLDVTPYIQKLGRIYERHSRFKDKGILYSQYFDEFKTAKLLPEMHNEMIWNYESLKNRELAVKQMGIFWGICNKSSSKWFKANNKDKELIKNCSEQIQRTSLTLANKWLRTWKKNPTHPQFADFSESAFKIYLKKEHNVEEFHKARFVYSEILFKRNKFKLASEHYYEAGLGFKAVKFSKPLAHDARYAAILSFEKYIQSEEKGKWSNSHEKNFRLYVAEYVMMHPKGKYRLDVEYKVALMDYEKGRYDVAAQSFLRLGESYKNKEKGLKSQDLYLDILNIKKDYTNLKNYSKKLMKRSKDIRVGKLRQIYEQSYFLEVQSLEGKKDYKKSIQEYKKFALENKKSKLAPEAWNNAVKLHYKMGEKVKGANASVKFYAHFPKYEKVKPALYEAVSTYELVGDLKSAAKVLEILIKIDKTKQKILTLLVAEYYSVSHQLLKAEMKYNELLKHPNSKEYIQALEKLENIYTHRKPYSKKIHFNILNLIIKSNVQPQTSLAQLKIIEDIYKSRDYPKTFTESKKILKMKNASMYAKSRARFIQAEILEGEFMRQSLKSSVERVSLVLSLKTSRLEKAQKAYQSAIRYGDPEVAVRSLWKLSNLYDSFVKSLKTMPLPKGLTSGDEKVFRAEIDNLIIPMEEKSVESMSMAFHQAKKLKLRSGLIPKLKDELNRLNFKKEIRTSVDVKLPVLELPTVQEVAL